MTLPTATASAAASAPASLPTRPLPASGVREPPTDPERRQPAGPVPIGPGGGAPGVGHGLAALRPTRGTSRGAPGGLCTRRDGARAPDRTGLAREASGAVPRVGRAAANPCP